MTDPVKPAGEQFAYEGAIFINLQTTFQWVHIKVFSLADTIGDKEALAKLIGHVSYRDSYASSERKDSVSIHGPYWLRAITPDSFVVADADAAERLVHSWAELHRPLPDAFRATMRNEVYSRFNTATVLYQLPDIRAIAEHEWGWVVGMDGFHEFVVIDRVAGALLLIVASDD